MVSFERKKERTENRWRIEAKQREGAKEQQRGDQRWIKEEKVVDINSEKRKAFKLFSRFPDFARIHPIIAMQ